MDTEESPLKGFVPQYEASFGIWPGAKKPATHSFWEDMLKPIPKDAYRRLFSRVEETFEDKMGKPQIPHFYRAWSAIRAEFGYKEPTRVFCPICGGEGVIAVDIVPPTDEIPCISFDPTHGVLHSTLFPCMSCDTGIKRKDGWGVAISSANCQIANTHHAKLLPQGPEAYEQLSLSEFLAKNPGDTVDSLVGKQAALRRHSMWVAAAKQGHDTAPYEPRPKTPSETLAKLRAKHGTRSILEDL